MYIFQIKEKKTCIVKEKVELIFVSSKFVNICF